MLIYICNTNKRVSSKLRKEKKLYNNLKPIRDKLGLTQNQVSDIAEITLRSYQNYEYSKRIPKVNIALDIAKALNTTVEELFSNDKLQ